MVERKKRIAAKPSGPPPGVDAWISAGGTDPENTTPTPKPSAPARQQPSNPGNKGKPFPHRISLDLSPDQYRALKQAAFDSDRSLNECLREALDQWLDT